MPTLATPPSPCQVPDDILPDFLPGGGISILAGAPNLGKTALLATMLRELQAGRPVFGHAPRQVSIGYVNTDRTWSKGAGLWLARVGIDLPYYSLCDDRTFNPKRLRRKYERVDVLISLIDTLKLPPDSLIIVDPIALFLGGNLLDYDSCACAALEIRAYLAVRQYTLLATAHSGKLKADKGERYVRTSDQILGSTAIPGFTDAVLHLASPEELGKSYYQLTWHPHGAKAEAYLLTRDRQGLFDAYIDTAPLEVIDQILQFIPTDGMPMTLAQILAFTESIPCSRRTTIRLLRQLVELGKLVHFGHGQYRRRVQ